MNKPQIISDKNKKSLKIKNLLTKRIQGIQFKKCIIKFFFGFLTFSAGIDADSIINVTKQQEKFLESIKNALLGENSQVESEEYMPPINQVQTDEYFETCSRDTTLQSHHVIQEELCSV